MIDKDKDEDIYDIMARVEQGEPGISRSALIIFIVSVLSAVIIIIYLATLGFDFGTKNVGLLVFILVLVSGLNIVSIAIDQKKRKTNKRN